ncbi:MAG TPA: hypothetical protein VGB26_15625 [Nitrospiria bacterium]
MVENFRNKKWEVLISIIIWIIVSGCGSDETKSTSSLGLSSGSGSILSVTSGTDVARGIAVDSSALYIAGNDQSTGHSQWRIEKRNLSDGSLINSFGKEGVVNSDPSTGFDEPFGIAVDSTSIYVVGYDIFPGDRQWRIEKRDISSGDLVLGFGINGVVTNNFSQGDDVAFAVAVDGTGVYIVGFDLLPGDKEWRLEKRNPTDGSLIWTKVGDQSSGNGTSDLAQSIVLDTTGAYIVGHDSSSGPSNQQWRIEKRNLVDGSLIWVQTNNPSPGVNRAVTVASDGTDIYIGGLVSLPGQQQWRMEKRNSSGGVVWEQSNHPSNGINEIRSIAVGGNGLYIAGFDQSPGNSQWRLEKRALMDGTIIWEQTTNPGNVGDKAYGAAVDSTGVYVVGFDSSRETDTQWRIEKRNLTDGSLIWVQTVNPAIGS